MQKDKKIQDQRSIKLLTTLSLCHPNHLLTSIIISHSLATLWALPDLPHQVVDVMCLILKAKGEWHLDTLIFFCFVHLNLFWRFHTSTDWPGTYTVAQASPLPLSPKSWITDISQHISLDQLHFEVCICTTCLHMSHESYSGRDLSLCFSIPSAPHGDWYNYPHW